MKKRLFAIIAVAAAASLACILAGCASQPAAEEKATEPTEVEGEKTVAIELPANGTTGYEWTYVMDPEGVLVEDSSEYVASDSATAGAPGVQKYVFSAGKDGEVLIEFHYARSWEDADPDSTATYQFRVTDGLIESTGMVQNFSEALQSQS